MRRSQPRGRKIASRALGLGLGLLALIATTGIAQAATLQLTGGVLQVSIGVLPPITIGQSPDPVLVFVSSGGGSFTEPAGLFSGTQNLPTQLFTGIPLISTLNVTAANGTKVVAAGGGQGGGFGGPGALTGIVKLGVTGGLLNLLIPLAVVGGGGVTAVGAAALAVTVTGNLWTTGAVAVTNITSTTISGALVNTLTLSGSDARTAGHAGTISLVTPIRILTNAAGNLPGFATQILTFAVPEPGTILLFGAGVLALVGLGRHRGRH